MAATYPARDAQFDNLMSEANIADPFPLYSVLRKEDPVHWNAHFGLWQLTRYQDVKAAFGDQARFSSASGEPVRHWAKNIPAALQADFEVCMRFFYDNIQTKDAPSHTLHRAAVSKAFTPRVLENMQASIEARIDTLLGNMQRKQTCDFVAEFAYPLPSLVIFDLIGVPEEHHEHIRLSAASFARFLPALYSARFDEIKTIASHLRTTESILLELITRKRVEPGSDLLSTLVSTQGAGSLSDAELAVLCNFLLFAGHETTANLLAGSVVHLLKNRNLWNQLLRRPELVSNSVEELLRYQPGAADWSHLTGRRHLARENDEDWRSCALNGGVRQP